MHVCGWSHVQQLMKQRRFSIGDTCLISKVQNTSEAGQNLGDPGLGYPASAHCHRFCDHTKAVAVYGGNGLFNWLPVSCWDISWPQELCQTVNSTFFLKLQRLCRRFPFVPTLPAPPLRNIWSLAIFSTRMADSSPTWREQLCKLNQFLPKTPNKEMILE